MFIDKHLADNWQDAKFIYDSARELKIPIDGGIIGAGHMAPSAGGRETRCAPPRNRGNHLSHHRALRFPRLGDAVQALAEQRQGGETGIKAVQTFSDEAVWRAFDEKSFDVELFDAAYKRLSEPRKPRSSVARESCASQNCFGSNMRTGCARTLLELNGATGEWTAAWRVR